MNGIAVEALLNQRLEIGAQPPARAQPEAARIGINVLAVEVRDVMFPAETCLRRRAEGKAGGPGRA